MDIRKLKYFVVLAEHKNYSSAARALFITQPTLSQQIKALEKELGVVLFDRANENSLTEAGRLLYPEAVKLIAQNQRCIDIINDHCAQASNTIKIATLNVLEYAIPPKLLNDFKSTNPDINITYYATDFDGAFGLVHDGSCDFSIAVIAEHSIPDYLDYITINTDDICLIYPKKYPLINTKTSSDDEIREILSMQYYSYKFTYIKDRRIDFINKYMGNADISYYDNFTQYLLAHFDTPTYTTFPYVYCRNLRLDKWYNLVPLPEEYGRLIYALLFKKSLKTPGAKKFLSYAKSNLVNQIPDFSF